jgi:hypothetical protein
LRTDQRAKEVPSFVRASSQTRAISFKTDEDRFLYDLLYSWQHHGHRAALVKL